MLPIHNILLRQRQCPLRHCPSLRHASFLRVALWAERLWDRAFTCPICRSAHVSSGNTADWIHMPFEVVSGVGLGMGVLDFGGDRRRGRGSLGWIQCRTGILIDDRLVCVKLTIFPYADYIVEFLWLAFLWYSHVQDRSGGWREMYTNVTVQKHPIWRVDDRSSLATERCRVSPFAAAPIERIQRIRRALYALSTYTPLHAIAYRQ